MFALLTCKISKNTNWKIGILAKKDLALWVLNLHSKRGNYEIATFESENFAAIKIIELKEHYMLNYELVKIFDKLYDACMIVLRLTATVFLARTLCRQ